MSGSELSVLVSLTCAVAVVSLVLVVRRMRRELRHLTGELHRLHETQEPAPPSLAALDPHPHPQSPPEPVAVITKIAQPDDVDLTASRVASVTLAGPLLKAAAFTYGVRRALDDEHRMRLAYTVRKELRRQRKMRRRRRAARAR